MPDVYVFSSSNLTNIWAGIGARRWAVSVKQAKNPSIQSKAKALPLGALGLFYCVETKSMTTPFVVTSTPAPGVEVRDVWPEPWQLPFGITTLGSPYRSIATPELDDLIPSLRGTGKSWNRFFFVTPIQVFASSKLLEADWSALAAKLLD